MSCFLPSQVERDAKIGKVANDDLVQQKVEILMALKKLQEQLTPGEEAFLQQNASNALKEFERVSPDDEVNPLLLTQK